MESHKIAGKVGPMGEISKQAAEELVKEAHAALKEARRIATESFVKALRIANAAGISDERLSHLINHDYSRTRIGQLRAGKIGRRDK